MQFKCFSVLVILIAIGSIKAEFPIRSVLKSFQKCFDKGGFNGVVNCAGLRTLNMMRSLSHKNTLEVLPGIVLQRDGPTDIPNKIMDEDLPINPVNRSEKILELLGDETMKLISQRTLTVKLPKINSEEISRALKEGEEGRGRKKNRFGNFGGMIGPIMISMAAKLFALIGGVGLLSAKAIVVAKLALLISVILLAQNYLSNRGTNYLPYYGGNSYYPSVTYGTNNLGGWNPQYPYARSLEVNGGSTESYEGEQLAYKGYTSIPQ
ncbi:uncharacterized protein LOC123680357 [Harmonia axyridis]|uniref:uncharacterized protein LOC123680357 n=1 Tax=Harmonia axyridis TaxID=115357 RepID=UPI001E275FD1|nr:uncharacterized protein LOC123680357 [Harmonia axyridis]